MKRRYNIDLEVYSSLKKKVVILKWYLNIVLFLVTLFWVDYMVLPAQNTSDVIVETDRGEPNIHFKTKKNFKFILDRRYLEKEEKVELKYTPVFRIVKDIRSSKNNDFDNNNGSLLVMHLLLFLVFLGARIVVGREVVVQAYHFLMVASSTFLIGLIDLLFLLMPA